MLLATVVLLFSAPQNADVPKPASAAVSLPSAPDPKVKTDSEAAPNGQAASSVAADVNSSSAAGATIEPGPSAAPIRPVKPAITRPSETRRQRVAWYALVFTGHSAAAFDAWSSRRAISRGYGTEGNPFLRPFSHSGALYAATQVSPAFLDFVGKRMMVSQNRWVRRMWWLPQAAGSGVSIAAGVHNVEVVP